MPFDKVTPSIVVNVPVVVSVAPTPDVPLLYVTVPPEIVAMLSREVNKATQDRVVLDKFEKLSFQTQPNTPEEFKKIIADEIAVVGKVAREANILIKR